jgi:adenosylmethionine-8-amino-7-oxononanoate aminotransferase
MARIILNMAYVSKDRLDGVTTAARPGGHQNLWGHFSEIGDATANRARPVVTRGRGAFVYDADGKRYFDALSSLYCVNVGHGRAEIAEAMARQARELEYFPIWGNLTPPALEFAERIADLAPAGMNRVFFTGGGSESVDAAWKLTRQHHRLRGAAGKTKIIARQGAYHGTSLGALSVTGVPSLREPFMPLVPGAVHGPKVDAFHAGVPAAEHSRRCADAMADLIEAEGPESVGAIIVEPIQNAGGCLVAEPEYFSRLRAICDAYDVLLISDETICSWGRIGTYFGAAALGYAPDIITTAKGITSAYVPMGAVIASDRVAEPFLERGTRFEHGLTFGGHPVAAAAGLANLAILEDERLCERSQAVGAAFRAQLETLLDLPIVGDVRGMAMFQAVELVADKAGRAPFSAEQTATLLATVPHSLFEAGVICRALHRGAPILQFAPPLIASEEDLEETVAIVRRVLERAMPLL